ncbi:MAG: URC4/urg3 family protein [Hyphomicrobiaceae bacterium]
MSTPAVADRGAALGLLGAVAVRERCGQVLAAGLEGRLRHFALAADRLPAVADYVTTTIRANYPGLDIPLHARWRHFRVAGADRWQAIAAGLDHDPDERARVRFDLAVTSVLLDAGAGPRWQYRDPVTGTLLARSEGLAIASIEAFRNGLFSTGRSSRLEADAPGLMRLTPDRLAEAFQAGPGNPLAGLEGRAALLNRLGATIVTRPDLFGAGGRIGGLYDRLRTGATAGAVEASDILVLLLEALGPIWPGRMTLAGVPLGDTWRHSAIMASDGTAGLVPFHKLSQWLAYSLVEPLEEAGLRVAGLDGLTGLAEYRNGGLFLDLGVLTPKDPGLTARLLAPGDEPIVEWRALTVALLDRLAPLVRERLGPAGRDLPLGAILEGGTWSAGRRIARERRADGGPPLRIESDGSVF